MFQTVRHWWGSGRGKVTARLFVFELFVVILGVLIAQGLANWAQDRADAHRVDDAKARLDVEVSRARANARELQPELVCLDRRLTWILDQAHEGYRFTRSELARPDIARYPPNPLPADIVPLFRQRFGADVADRYDRVMVNAAILDQFFLTVRDTWPELELLDTSWGPPDGGDPAGVRRAALRLRLAIAKMQLRVDDIETAAADLHIAPRTFDLSGGPATTFKTCDQYFAMAGIRHD